MKALKEYSLWKGKRDTDTLGLLEYVAKAIADDNGGFVSVDIPPPDTFTVHCLSTAGVLSAWDMPDYLAVRWHPIDGFDYQLGMEMDKRHVSREVANKLLTEKLWLRHIDPDSDEAAALLRN